MKTTELPLTPRQQRIRDQRRVTLDRRKARRQAANKMARKTRQGQRRRRAS